MLVLTFTGRKSGRQISTPVGYTRLGDRLVCTSLRRRTWWRNLRGGAPVKLYLQGRSSPALAQAVENDADVRRGFAEYFRLVPAARRMYGIHPSPDGVIGEQEMQHLVGERLVAYFKLQDE